MLKEHRDMKKKMGKEVEDKNKQLAKSMKSKANARTIAQESKNLLLQHTQELDTEFEQQLAQQTKEETEDIDLHQNRVFQQLLDRQNQAGDRHHRAGDWLAQAVRPRATGSR